MKTNILYTLAFILICFTSCGTKNNKAVVKSQENEVMKEVDTHNDGAMKEVKTPKNVIFLIGDGMGVTQISAGLYSNSNQLSLERINNIGFHKSYSYDKLITDSAAGATAFACGVKTYNGAIGVGPDTLPRVTLLEEAENLGLVTGLVATSTIVHATPASFISHNKYRKNYEEIALDFLNTDIELFIGGGKKFFYNREDGRDLYKEFRAKGYKMSDFFTEELVDIDMDGVEKMGFLTAEDSPIPVAQGRDYLLPASKLAIDFLDDKEDNGFFLMIEGSQIDWGGHANNSNYIITEMLDFNKVINAVLDFAEKDGETLVVITADHETGGYAIQKESKMDSIVGAFTTDYHTADLIPVFAYGPGSDDFRGIYENTDIYHKIRNAMKWVKK